MTRSFLVLLAVTSAAAAPRTTPTIKETLGISIVSTPQISPDGTQVVYQKGRTEWKENAFDCDLWIASVAEPHNPRNLGVGPGWNGDPKWSPDGKSIAFIGDRSGRRQLFVVPASGGEPRKLTRAERGVGEFHWAPDGKSIAFLSDVQVSGNEDFEVVNEVRVLSRLWHVAIPEDPAAKPAPPRQLLKDAALSVGAFAWSPGGDRIVFQSGGIYVLEVASGDAIRVAAENGPFRNPVWSPDGNSIAFETAGGAAGFYYSNWYIAKAPAAGGKIEPLTKSFDENADLVAWTKAGIYFSALQRTASHLFSVDPETLAIRRVTDPEDSINTQFSTTPDGARVAFMRSSETGLADVYVSDAGGSGHAVRLTDSSDQTAGFEFAQRELVRWKSADGTEIEGVLLKPADFDPAKKYPLLVVIHGGPVAIDQPLVRPDRNYPVEQFVARGALVLRPNYRGSAGYGAELRALPVKNLGAGDAADILSGVDALVEKGFVDAGRIGVMGWSEGGYISAYLATTTTRFAAASVGAGISDWLAYYAETDITPFTRQYFEATPWAEPDLYRKASPITYINQASTPVLIQHGDDDARVPISNAYELRQALEDRHVPVKMVVYKGFGHSIDRPRQQQAVMEHNLEWFDRWVFGGTKNVTPPVTISETGSTRVVAGDNIH